MLRDFLSNYFHKKNPAISDVTFSLNKYSFYPFLNPTIIETHPVGKTELVDSDSGT